MDEHKQAFLNDYGGLYGYPNSPKSIDQIQASEFKRLDGLFLFFFLRFRFSSKLINSVVCFSSILPFLKFFFIRIYITCRWIEEV